jgi:hypothetical protein
MLDRTLDSTRFAVHRTVLIAGVSRFFKGLVLASLKEEIARTDVMKDAADEVKLLGCQGHVNAGL